MNKFAKNQNGASMVEYAILVAVIASAALLALNEFSPKIKAAFTAIGDKVVNSSK